MTDSAMRPLYWDEAKRALSRRDPRLRRLIARFPDIAISRRYDPFTTLVRAITGQQISVKAADTVWARIVAAPGGQPRRVVPSVIVGLEDGVLRSCGLSTRKAEYIRDLAARFADGRIRPRRWHAMDDEAVIAELDAVKGIGRWTAEMFLMFSLLRPDVLPVDDIGLQRAVELLYNDGERMTIAELRRIAEPWAPWRSVATWYLWRSIEPEPIQY